ncbi:MAG TPA: secretin N-terminal domain-containing protein, partial [Verrucomicrobiae bacterium]|nr:secretin N-terminal domain-containing protein [Verrucomicrobiae bacterium]
TELPSTPTSSTNKLSDEDVQLSFQNANIDMIVQWLAKNTGKSVVKHPKVQCQLTIVSSKKLKPREAVNLVYRALALEGFAIVETSKSILIVPEGQEPKMTPEIIASPVDNSGLPEGRQRLIRIFQFEHVDPAEVRDKIKGVLSDKGTIEVVDRARQLIITDYTDNIRLAGELIKELDVPSSSDTALEFFKLKHADADEVSTLLTQILNAQPASPKAPSSSGEGPQSIPGGPPGMPGTQPSPSPRSGGGGAASSGTGPVKIWPDKTSNQLIVSAPRDKMAEIRGLLEVLDKEKTEDISLRVLPLKNVSADDLVKEVAPLYQKMSAKSPKDRVDITANTRSNSLIIYSSEDNFKSIEKLVASLDREEAQEKIMKVFMLQNADAEDVAKQLGTLNEGQDNQNRYPYYISFYGSDRGGGKTSKPSFVADRRRNAVIVQSPPSQMDRIEKLIETLDAPSGENTIAPKIFRLKYISAVDLEDVLNELFLKKQQQRSYWDYYDDFYGGGGSNSRDSSGGKLYGKVRVTSEPYSNSIIVTSNSPEGIAAIEDVIKELDSPSQAGETTMHFDLKFARATTLASDINILFAKNGSPQVRPQAQPQQQQPGQIQQPNGQNNTIQSTFGLEQETKEDVYFPWLGGQQDNPFGGRFDSGSGRSSGQRPVSDLIGRVRVVPDRRGNSLLITCNLHFFPEILKLIERLDAPTPQVLLEAKIIEVSSDFRDKLGVRWSPDGASFTGEDLEDSAVVNVAGTYKKIFAGTAAGDTLRSGVLDASVNLNVLIQFLRKNTDAKVLAEPQLNIADNEAGKLFVGSQVPFISGSLNTEVGGRNDTFQYRDVGIILELIPHINTADQIALKIRTEASSIRSGETLFGGAILDTRNFKTDLMVKDSETVVLGGIIQREDNNVVRKVPGLGDIPGLGWLFKKKDKITREVELMVFLRPKITRTAEQARALLDEVEHKVPLIKGWQEERPAPAPVPPQ